MASFAIACIFILMPTTGSATGGVRGLDFRNFAYPWSELEDSVPAEWKWIGPADSTVKLVNGRRDFDEPGLPRDGAYLMLKSVAYGDIDGDGAEEAAVDLLYGTGGTANWHYLYVYAVEHGKPRVLAWLQSGSRADGGLLRAAIRNRTLVLEFTDTDRRIADCCSEGYIRVTYQWRRTRFVEAGRERGDLK